MCERMEAEVRKGKGLRVHAIKKPGKPGSFEINFSSNHGSATGVSARLRK